MEDTAAITRIPASHWETSSDLAIDLMLAKTPRPFWIEFDRQSMLVTDQRAYDIASGLRIAGCFDLATA